MPNIQLSADDIQQLEKLNRSFSRYLEELESQTTESDCLWSIQEKFTSISESILKIDAEFPSPKLLSCRENLKKIKGKIDLLKQIYESDLQKYGTGLMSNNNASYAKIQDKIVTDLKEEQNENISEFSAEVPISGIAASIYNDTENNKKSKDNSESHENERESEFTVNESMESFRKMILGQEKRVEERVISKEEIEAKDKAHCEKIEKRRIAATFVQYIYLLERNIVNCANRWNHTRYRTYFDFEKNCKNDDVDYIFEVSEALKIFKLSVPE